MLETTILYYVCEAQNDKLCILAISYREHYYLKALRDTLWTTAVLILLKYSIAIKAFFSAEALC